jgi:hypothetical protein
MNENQRELVKTARIAGFWYLLLAIFGILGFMVFHSQVYVSGNPEETLSNLTEKESLSRVRLLFELLLVLAQALAAFWFYKLFKSINDTEAWAIGIWGMVNSIVIMISAIAMASAIQIANSSVLNHEEQLVLIEVLGDLIKHSWNVGGLFFGLWLLPMGHIVTTSKRMPLWLGRTLILGGAGYILQTLIYYSGFNHSLLKVLTIPATVGEFWMIGYLLIYGIRPLKKTLDISIDERS